MSLAFLSYEFDLWPLLPTGAAAAATTTTTTATASNYYYNDYCY